MPSHTLTLKYTRSGETLTSNVSVTADGEVNADVSLTASQSNKEVDMAVDVSALLSLYVLSTTAITMKTNSSGAPDDTLSVAANKPFVWYSGSGITCPLGTDVTKFYITNGAASVGAVNIRTLQDSTP